ncbi:hypothetical protein [Geobacter argillaceus]|uniref:hypothetical protein n=1 Tax=Geobacter argillaceus TaxID=345631 RepID=UPI0011A862EA|nr:hypothetical protein [Geobacter argillaceus]
MALLTHRDAEGFLTGYAQLADFLKFLLPAHTAAFQSNHAELQHMVKLVENTGVISCTHFRQIVKGPFSVTVFKVVHMLINSFSTDFVEKSRFR